MKVVRTYATSANLGPGFDCLGICFDIYNEYTFEKSNKYELIGFDKGFLDPKNNLIILAYEKYDREQAKDNVAITKYRGVKREYQK